MLSCPKCQTGLEKRSSESGIFWHCSSCDGRAATLPLLRRSVLPEFLRGLWQSASQGAITTDCRCPFCNRSMAEVSANGVEGEFNLDVCTSCHLVWFDPNEFQILPPKPQSSAEPVLPAAARERLALLKVEQIRERAAQNRGGDAVSPEEWWQWLPGVLGMPIEDSDGSTVIRPWVTWGLTLAIAILSICAFFDLPTAVERFGLVPAQYGRYGGMTVISSFFLHAGGIHLLGNLYFLCIFGDNVEEILGKRSFLLLLFTSQLLGCAAHILWHPNPDIPCIGASGGIAGVLAYYALQFPRVRLQVFVRGGVFYRWLKFPAWVWFLFWILLQALGTWRQISGLSLVSSLAHLGGALGGALFFWAGRRSKQESSQKKPEM
jgi:membrane associated rhomboid family serine protease/Zn-finger nucleic acid-binding protein